MLFWRVPAPNEALLISGSKRRREETQFRIVTGHGSFVMPVKQRARLLSLALREAEITEECITNQGIRLNVRAVAAFKVGDDSASIANAARRFLSEQDRMETLVGRVFAGHLRSIVGGLTVEQIIRERDRVAQEIKDGSHAEMEKLGIVVDALEIQEIEDSSGYISNLAAPHAAAAASQARIAKAKADMEAAEREMAAFAMKAQYERDLSIKQAGYLAETQQAKARAEQAGPLAEAETKQQVIQQQTALAQHEAELAAQRLEAEVRRPADAEAYRTRTLAEAGRDQARFATEAEAFRKRQIAEADRDQARLATEADAFRQTTLAESAAQATRVKADAQAHAERAQAQGQADANHVLAASLAQGNQELIAASTLVENLPSLVEAAARGLAGTNLTVLNGTQGVNEVMAGLVGQGFAILELLKKSATVPVPSTNGTAPALRETVG
ncbi:flotillin family protein [Trebonia kvetii]|uniref:Flotillin family protein n=1 Tax=Trebonia kvetii TaxID=2480626 RepID=A0A6P2C684_9ACTN|nr:flotillin family protein [Trebonia kvetii]TVZ06015.1 flotillin family protein [Trebonia kvetii]